MAALSQGVFTSKLFTFIVGKNQASIIVHAAVLATQSNALNALINGFMSEAQAGTAVFEDVLEETFDRFCQYAYTGDYQTPCFVYQPEAELSAQVSPTTLTPDLVTDDRYPIAETNEYQPKLDKIKVDKPKNAKMSSKSGSPRAAFDERLYNIETAQSISIARCSVRKNTCAAEDYTPVFLGHARLYVLAEMWGMDALKTLSLHKLHRTLVIFTLYTARRSDIVELVRYAYSDDHTPDLPNGAEGLRALVVHYVTSEITSLVHSEEFLSLIEEGGSFARDLVQMMTNRFR